MSKTWRIEYAVDAFGAWKTEAETETEAWEKFKTAWRTGKVAPPDDFGDLDADNLTVKEEQ